MTFDLLAEASAGGNVVVVQVGPEVEEPLKHAVQQPLLFQYFEASDPDPIEFHGKVMRLISHSVTGRTQIQVEIERFEQ